MQFIVIARDSKDPTTPETRKRVRPGHIEIVLELRRQGHFIIGGAMLDDEGEMRGSVAIVEFPSRAGVDEWLAKDPYVSAGVWTDIEIYPYKVAIRHDIEHALF